MAYTSQKTLAATTTEGDAVQAGRVDPSLQVYPQKEVLNRETVRYEPLSERVMAPNIDDDINLAVDIEPWSD